MLVGCNQPVGVPNDVQTATTHTLYMTTDNFMDPTGHIDWYQPPGETSAVWWYYTFNYYEIERAFRYYDQPPLPPDTMLAHPRKNGFYIFRIPPFTCNNPPACTLFYYQDSHNGSPDLLVNAWYPGTEATWPPLYQTDLNDYFWAIWNSTDTVATDITHPNDGCWYKVPLTSWACQAIRDSGAWHYQHDPNGCAWFWTGWKYPSYSPNHGQHGWFTNVSGYNANPPYVKVVYEN